MKRERLDSLLVAGGHFPSREQAQRAIRAGEVMAGGQRALKPGKFYPEKIELDVKSGPRYVSRGGEKLRGALGSFALSVRNSVCLDVGASTGGFTDCLLKEGAGRVYSLDVGRGQLAFKLRKDPRVRVIEGRNARYLRPDDFPEAMDLATVDVAFISLDKILPALIRVIKSGGSILALIKPQFEAGPSRVGRGGVVTDGAVHEECIRKIKGCAEKIGMRVEGVSESVLRGPAGNREFFILMTK